MPLFDVVNEELLKGYQQRTGDRNHIDTMAWLCKALAASGMSKYVKTLEKVADTATNTKLQKFARKSLRLLVNTTEF